MSGPCDNCGRIDGQHSGRCATGIILALSAQLSMARENGDGAIEMALRRLVAEEREAIAALIERIDRDPANLAAAIRARGALCRCGHSRAAHMGPEDACLGSASPRESCACRLFRGAR